MRHQLPRDDGGFSGGGDVGGFGGSGVGGFAGLDDGGFGEVEAARGAEARDEVARDEVARDEVARDEVAREVEAQEEEAQVAQAVVLMEPPPHPPPPPPPPLPPTLHFLPQPHIIPVAPRENGERVRRMGGSTAWSVCGGWSLPAAVAGPYHRRVSIMPSGLQPGIDHPGPPPPRAGANVKTNPHFSVNYVYVELPDVLRSNASMCYQNLLEQVCPSLPDFSPASTPTYSFPLHTLLSGPTPPLL
jgi:hypothetical protein